MSRVNFAIEQGLDIESVNGSLLATVLAGSAAPGNDSGPQDAAPIGSIYLRTNGLLYRKIANAGALADWTTDPDLSNLTWREPIKAATNDTLAAGNYDPTAWSDNESGIDHTSFSIGDVVLGDADGTPALFEVTAVGVGTGSDEITLAVYGDALAENDTFLVRYYLPDSPAAQEIQAIVTYQGGNITKVSDANWELATGINISGGYDATGDNGPIVAGTDTVESALEKLEGDIVDHLAADGLSRGDVNYGSFASPASLLLAASQTAKQLFQRIGDLLAQLRGVEVTGVTTEASVDEVPHATVKAVKWLVYVFEQSTPTNWQAFEVYAANDGTNVDDTLYAKLKNGTVAGLTITVDISGANMRLRAASTNATTIRARRIEVIKSVL